MIFQLYRYKLGYHSGPEVHHVYLAPPPPQVRYVEYVEKPVYVPHIVEKPVFKPAHFDHYEPAWSQQDPSPAYGLVYIHIYTYRTLWEPSTRYIYIYTPLCVYICIYIWVGVTYIYIRRLSNRLFTQPRVLN